MKRANVTYKLSMQYAWWWAALYVPAIFLMASLGIAPNWDKVQADALRALRLRLVRVKP